MPDSVNIKNREEIIEMFIDLFGISRINAEILVDSGYSTISSLAKAEKDQLVGLGIPALEAERIISQSDAVNSTDVSLDGTTSIELDETMKKWLDEAEKESVQKKNEDESKEIKEEDVQVEDVVSKWVEGDIDSIDQWINDKSNVQAPIIKKKQISQEDLEVLKIREEAAFNILKKYADQMKTNELNPMKIIEDNVQKAKELESETIKRKNLEAEMKKLMAGSIALIRYIRAQENKKFEEKEKALIEENNKIKEEFNKLNEELKKLKESVLSSGNEQAVSSSSQLAKTLLLDNQEMKKKISEYEQTIEKMKAENTSLQEKIKLLSMDRQTLDTTVDEKMSKYLNYEESINNLKNENERLKDQLIKLEEENKKINELLISKQDEINRWTEDLRKREEQLDKDKKSMEYSLEEAKKANVSLDSLQYSKKLKDMENEVIKKEEELKAREKYVNARLQEIINKEKGLVGEEIKMNEAEKAFEVKEQKVKTGILRLDDLMYGGIPMGSNVLISGPAHSGKEMFLNTFILEGLKKGIPAVVILTDKTIQQFSADMSYIVPTYQQYHSMELVRYVDMYTKTVKGEEISANYAIYLEKQNDFATLSRVVDSITAELKEKHPYYRLIFESLTTLITISSPTEAFKFLQPFAGKRKIENAVSMYLVETGVHADSDIQTLNHMMDGEIAIKIENLKTFFSIKGITDVQSRAPINFTFTRKSINIGSFTLDHIR
ncbi:MAG: DUF7504 family protein [Thermoplasmata archaeon]